MGLKKPTPAGLDTTDATMIATDLIANKTGYAKGEKVTGNLPVNSSGTYLTAPNANVSGGVTYLNLRAYNPGNPFVVPLNGQINMNALLTAFGDATVSEVLSGKTFTSADGFKQTGTLVCDNLASMTADANASAADLLLDKTAYVNGAKITGTNVRVNRQWGTLTGNIPNVTGLSFDPTWAIIFPKLAITADGGTNHSCLLACIDGNTFSLQYDFISQIISRQNTASFSHSQGSFNFSGYTPALADIEYYYICGN